MFWSDVKKNAKRIWWRKRVTAKSRPMTSLIARAPSTQTSFCIRKLGEEKLWKSKSSEYASREKRWNGETRCLPWHKSRAPPPPTCWKHALSKLIRMGRWLSLVFSRVEIWWINWWKQERWDLLMNSHLVCSKSTRTDLLLMTMIWTLSPKQNQTCRLNHGYSCTGWMIECERSSTNPQKMQCKTATNIL